MLKINKITVITSLLFASIFLLSCAKNVPDVPIFIDLNGFDYERYADDFDEKLRSKLKSHGFRIVSEASAEYKIIVNDFYYLEYYFTVDAPSDDCNYSSYDLLAYEYGIRTSLLDRNNKTIKTWNDDRSKEDELKEDDVYENCTSYKISSPLLLGGSFFRQEAIDVAKKASQIVADD